MNIRAKVFGRESPAPSVVQVKHPKGAVPTGLGAIAISRAESRRSNGRASDRHRLLDEDVHFLHGDVEHRGKLINLSGGGAMIADVPKHLKLWDRIDLTVGDHGTVECAVRWIRDDRAGLEFAHETQLKCPADQRAAVLRKVIARSFPDLDFGVPADPPKSSDDVAQSQESRGARRHALIWWATLHHDFQSTKVRIRNISPTGAMIEYEGTAPVGAEPLLELGDGPSITGTIAWVVGDHIGLRFHRELDLDVLASTRPQVAPQEWAPPAYLSKAKALGTPWDPRWKRMSVEDLQNELSGFLKY